MAQPFSYRRNMPQVVQSNRMERLFEALAERLAVPLDDPLAAERIVIPNTGLARWLERSLAERLGIAANLNVQLPASFVWEMLRLCVPEAAESNPHAKNLLLWRVLAALEELPADGSFDALRRYLDGGDPLKLYQLARRIADLLDQYLVYRPDWILAWDRGEEEHWQARLWRRLRDVEPRAHRAQLQQRFLATDLSAFVLPQRISVFGISALEPASHRLLTHLAATTEVRLYLLSPTSEFQGDLVPEATRARLRARWHEEHRQDVSEYYETGHPLLADWGRPGRDYQELLFEHESLQTRELFEAPEGDTLLRRIQRDILDFTEQAESARVRIPDADRSLRIHACPGPLREVEVVHDQLLDLFQRHADLEPRDLVVMTPDIDRYAPYIRAVFGAADAERYIPWDLVDLPPEREAAYGDFLLALLRWPEGRTRLSEVLDLLELPACARRFGFTAAELASLRGLLVESGVRWGADAEQREALGLGSDDTNTWVFGLRRMLLGFMLPERSGPLRGVEPLVAMGQSEAALAGKVWLLLERLRYWSRALRHPLVAAEWQARLLRLLDDFLDSTENDEALAGLRSVLDGLSVDAGEGGHHRPLQRELVLAHLTGALDEERSAHRYAGGRVTFCAMVPMRAVPFRVVALLGLNDSRFPRRPRPVSFDRIAAGPRRLGDRSIRDEDRQLFLDALLSARDYLLLSYSGRDPRDNSELQPALMLSQLEETVTEGYVLDGALRVEHPLQPFSERYRSANAEVFTYAREWFPEAAAEASAPFFEDRLSEIEGIDVRVDIADLEGFYRNPARDFLRRRLGVRLYLDGATLPDEEPFALDTLELYRLRGELVDGLLGDERIDALLAQVRRRGEAPLGAFGELGLRGEGEQALALSERVRAQIRGEPRRVEIDLSIGAWRLQGWLDRFEQPALVSYRAGDPSGRDLLALWIRHLLLNAVETPAHSVHIAKAADWTLAPLPAAQALDHLRDLLELREQGGREPLRVFPKSSFKFARSLRKDADPAKALRQAEAAWIGGNYSTGEGADTSLVVAFRDLDPFAPPFAELAERVFNPALDLFSETRR